MLDRGTLCVSVQPAPNSGPPSRPDRSVCRALRRFVWISVWRVTAVLECSAGIKLGSEARSDVLLRTFGNPKQQLTPATERPERAVPPAAANTFARAVQN